MKIAVIGGAGFIGRHLCKAYLDAGHSVVVIDSLHHGLKEAIDPAARFYQLDIRHGDIQSLLESERPDVVSLHITAGEAIGCGEHHVQGTQSGKRGILLDADVQIRGLLNVLDGCVSAGVQHIIFASGGTAMYGYTEEQSHIHGSLSCYMKESAELHPRWPHDISKVASEWYVRFYAQAYGLKHTILRYGDVYGETRNEHPAHQRHPLSYFIQMLQERRRPIIQGPGNEIRDHIFIDDVVAANLSSLRKLHTVANQTFNISSGQGYTLFQLFQMAAFQLHSHSEPVCYTDAGVKLSAILDNRKAQTLLDWKPEIDLEEGIRRAVTLLHQEQPTLISQNSQADYNTTYEPVPVAQAIHSAQNEQTQRETQPLEHEIHQLAAVGVGAS